MDFIEKIEKLSNVKILSVLFISGILSRLPFLEKMQSHWDGPQYTIAVLRFDFSQQTPAPPGYPLYIAFGRILNVFINEPHLALLYISVIFTGIGSVIVYLTGQKIFNKIVGLIAASIFLTAPVFFYFGISVYAYLPLVAINSLIALLVFLITFKKKKYGIFLGISFGFLIGFRPQEILFMTALFIFGLLNMGKREKILCLLFTLMTITAWLFPISSMVGGIQNFISQTSPVNNDAFPPISLFYPLKQSAALIFKGVFLTFGISLLALFFYFGLSIKLIKNKLRLSRHGKKLILFFSSWIAPELLFNLFIRIDHAGYQMAYLSAFLILVAYGIWQLNKKSPNRLAIYLVLIISFNLWWFFRNRDPNFLKPYTPTSFHYSEIIKNNIRLKGKLDYIKNNYNDENVLIITSPDPWRPLMYYLTNYHFLVSDFMRTSDPKLSSISYLSYKWNFEKVRKDNNIFIIPEKVNNLIFADDEASVWVKNKNAKTISLSGNSSITVVRVDHSKKIHISPNKITVD